VRLVDPEGRQLGIKGLPEALNIARDLDLDLVEVAPMADPPVCRILDYGKWKYEAAQRDKESRRRTTSASIKEMKYRPKIGTGDFGTKTRKVGEFLDQGHKVKVTIMFRGREMAHPELGKRILDRIAEMLNPGAKVEVSPKLDGRNMIMVLAPDKRARAAAAKAAAEGDSGGDAAPSSEGDEIEIEIEIEVPITENGAGPVPPREGGPETVPVQEMVPEAEGPEVGPAPEAVSENTEEHD